MPTYEYQCDACGHAFEKFQSIMAAPVKVCPKCGKRKVRKLISAGAGLIFKGSGFYITDYREGTYSKDAKADSAAPAEAKSGDAKSDGKSSDAKSGETKSPESKPAETKAADSKDSKPAAEPAKPAAKVDAPAKPTAARKDSAKSSKKR